MATCYLLPRILGRVSGDNVWCFVCDPSSHCFLHASVHSGQDPMNVSNTYLFCKPDVKSNYNEVARGLSGWPVAYRVLSMTWFWPSVLPFSPAVTPEAIGFLSAVGVFVVLLTILFLFINKKLCFSRVGGLPCFELRGHRKRKERSGIHQGLGEYAVIKHVVLSPYTIWSYLSGRDRLHEFHIDQGQSRVWMRSCIGQRVVNMSF